MPGSHGPLRIGIGGPVGSGKTALMDLLCKTMRERYDIAAITNDIDLAPHVGASLEKMDTDARRMRGQRPFVMTNRRKSEGLDRIVSFIEDKGGLGPPAQDKVG